MFAERKSSLAIVLGFMIAGSMITSLITWSETGPVIFMKEHLDQEYQIAIAKLPYGDYNYSTYDIYDFIEEEGLVGRIDLVYTTVALFNTIDKSNEHEWNHDDSDVVLAYAFILDDNVLETIQDEFEYEGELRMDGRGVLLSRSLYERIGQNDFVGGAKGGLGSKIFFSLATDVLNIESPAEKNRLGDWNRVWVTSTSPGSVICNITLVGLYDWIEPKHFSTRVMGRFMGVGYYEYLNLMKYSLFVPSSFLNTTIRSMIESGSRYKGLGGPPKLLIQLDTSEAAKIRIQDLLNEIEKLVIRTASNFEEDIDIEWDKILTDELSRYVNVYSAPRNLLIYLIPGLGVSACVPFLSLVMVFGQRRREAGILRSKGISRSQLHLTFMLEYAILSVIGVALGFFLGIIGGCIVPSVTGLELDPEVLTEYLGSVQISPYALLWSLTFCAAFTPIPIKLASSYAGTDIVTAMRAKVETVSGMAENWKMDIAFFLAMAAAIMATKEILFPYYVAHAQPIAGVGFGMYLLFLILWFIFAYSVSLIVMDVLPVFSKVFRFPLKTKEALLSADLKQKTFTPVIAILILTSSVLVFSLVEAETSQKNLEIQVEYSIGCDYRIETHPTDISYAKVLKSMCRFSTVTPIVRINGYVEPPSSVRLTIIGIEPLIYGDLYRNHEYLTSWSFRDPPFNEALLYLNQSPDGIIVGESLASTFEIGRRISVRTNAGTLKFTVIGIMNSAPGLGLADPLLQSQTGSFGYQQPGEFVIASLDYLEEYMLSYSDLFFAGARLGTNMTETIEALMGLPLVKEVHSPSTFRLEEVDMHRFTYMQGANGILYVQFAATAAIAISGLSFFLEYVVSKKSVEFAVLRALGATRKDVTLIIFSEILATVVLSLTAGAFLGIAFSKIQFDVLLLVFPFGSSAPYLLVSPTFTIVLSFVAVFAAMSIASLMASRKAGRTDVVRVLRNL